MTNITKLPDKWRKQSKTKSDVLDNISWCADELEAALPKWTKITDDPKTWPEKLDRVVFSFSSESHCWIAFMQRNPAEDGLLTCYWRPLCSVDYPPEDM